MERAAGHLLDEARPRHRVCIHLPTPMRARSAPPAAGRVQWPPRFAWQSVRAWSLSARSGASRKTQQPLSRSRVKSPLPDASTSSGFTTCTPPALRRGFGFSARHCSRVGHRRRGGSCGAAPVAQAYTSLRHRRCRTGSRGGSRRQRRGRRLGRRSRRRGFLAERKLAPRQQLRLRCSHSVPVQWARKGSAPIREECPDCPGAATAVPEGDHGGGRGARVVFGQEVGGSADGLLKC